MESMRDETPNPNPSSEATMKKEKNKVVVIMGATGSGKSRLAIDLASHFAGVEVINADSMQVYRGLDVLTNKVPLSERNGVPHHLLGTVDASVEFTSREFRDLAVPIIDDVLSRNCIPVVVGGTNYYIQALVSPFLIDDVVEAMAEDATISPQESGNVEVTASYERLREIDLVAANRIHPNDQRKGGKESRELDRNRKKVGMVNITRKRKWKRMQSCKRVTMKELERKRFKDGVVNK